MFISNFLNAGDKLFDLAIEFDFIFSFPLFLLKLLLIIHYLFLSSIRLKVINHCSAFHVELNIYCFLVVDDLMFVKVEMN